MLCLYSLAWTRRRIFGAKCVPIGGTVWLNATDRRHRCCESVTPAADPPFCEKIHRLREIAQKLASFRSRSSTDFGSTVCAFPYRSRARALSCKVAAAANQTCQCENRPSEIGNWPVAFRSAASLQKARTAAITAPGVNRAASASARCWFLRRFCLTFGPAPNLIRTSIPVQSQFISFGSNSIAKNSL
jgi:hypothetical protein